MLLFKFINVYFSNDLNSYLQDSEKFLESQIIYVS